MLDTEQDYLFALVRPLVTQSIWFGLPNMLMSRLAINPAPDKVLAAGRKLLAAQDLKFIQALYERYKDDPLVKWKESITRKCWAWKGRRLRAWISKGGNYDEGKW